MTTPTTVHRSTLRSLRRKAVDDAKASGDVLVEVEVEWYEDDPNWPQGIWSIEVRFCPFCGSKHWHGGGSDERPHLGPRGSHCQDGGGTYILWPREVLS